MNDVRQVGINQLNALNPARVHAVPADTTIIRRCATNSADGAAVCCVLVPGEHNAQYVCLPCAIALVADWLSVNSKDHIAISVAW